MMIGLRTENVLNLFPLVAERGGGGTEEVQGGPGQAPAGDVGGRHDQVRPGLGTGDIWTVTLLRGDQNYHTFIPGI